MPSTKTKLKGGKLVGKVGTKAGRRLAPHAGKAAWKLGKAEAKLLRAAMKGREPRGSRYLKYGLFLAIGLALGAVARSAAKPAPPHPPGPHDHSHDEPRIGTHGGGFVSTTVVPQEQDEVEQRIRTRIGDDHRTRHMPRPNVTVTDGVAELRGPAPDEETKAAAVEIAENTEGVTEVRNLLVVT